MAKKIAKENKAKKPAGKSFFERYRWELIIFAFSALLYANSIPNGYNMDDELVTNNHRLTSKGISAIPEIFTTTYYKDNMGYAYEYRPMVLTSFAIEHQIFGDNPSVSHFFNLLLYGLCCVLLFRVLLLITGGLSVLIPFAITLIFVAHPAHTEVVTSIKNRDEILGLIFSLLTWMAAFRSVKGGYKWLAAVPVLFMSAVMSKMSVLPFNLIIPLAVILFTEAGFKRVMAISLLLALGTFVAVNAFLYDKVVISTGLISATFLLFIFLRFDDISNRIKEFFKVVMARPSLFSTNLPESFDTPGLKKIFAGITFDFKPFLSFQPIAVTAGVSVIYLTGMLTSFPALIVMAGAGFFALLVWGNEKTIWWATVALYACLVATLFKYPVGASVFADILTICLVYQIIYGDRKLFIPSLVFYVVSFFFEPFSTAFGVGVVALISFRWKWTWPITAVYLAGGLYSSVTELSRIGFFSNRGLFSEGYGILMAFLLIISIFSHRGTKVLITSFQILSFAALFSLHVIGKPMTPYLAQTKVREQITTLGRAVPTNIVADKVDRPIVFVEQPVTAKSPLELRLGTALEILFIYLHKVVFPYPMSFYYGYQFIKPEHITDTVPVISLLLYGALFLLTLFCLKRSKLTGFGLMIYLISIASASSFFFPIPGQLGERFLFIPSLGWSIVLVIGLVTVFKFNLPVNDFSFTKLPNGFKYPLVVLLCLYSVMTVARNFDWKDYTTLSKHDISYVENSSQANNLLALNLMQKSYEIADPAAQLASRKEALEHFKKALALYPQFYNVTYDVARVFNVLNQNDSAVFYFKQALALDSTNPNPALFAGDILNQQGKYAEAIPLLEYASRHSVDYQPFDKLSYAYFKINEYNKSIATNLRAITALPPQAAPYTNIARVYIAINQMDSARLYLQKALPFNPNDKFVQQLMQQASAH